MRYSLVLLLIWTASNAVATDVLLLSNGDRISGTLVSIASGVATVTTDYAGTITVQMDAVTAIETAEPRTMLLSDGSIVETVLSDKSGQSASTESAAGHSPALSDVVMLADNAEALDALINPPPPSKWSGTVDAGLALRSGNTDTTDIKLAAGVVRTGTRDKLTLNISSAYGSVDSTLNTRRAQGDVKWQYYLRERLYLLGTGLAERDDGRKLDYRLQVGAGIGYDFIKNDRRSLSADAGLTFTKERWAPFTPWERDSLRDGARVNAYNQMYAMLMGIGSGNKKTVREIIEQARSILADMRDPLRAYTARNDEYMNLRLGALYSQKIFKASTLSEELVVMPNLEDFGEFRAISDFALTTPLSSVLDLRTSLKTEYDSLAADRGVKRWDNTLMTQFRYKF